MTIKHLVTSGCSFSDNPLPDLSSSGRWPYFLSDLLGTTLYNRGQGGAGNTWISKSAIYQTQKLLDDGIDAKEILVVVMWSGIDRKDLFIDYGGAIQEYREIVNEQPDQTHGQIINFLDHEPNWYSPKSTAFGDGYLVGAVGFSGGPVVTKFKKDLSRFYSCQSLAIESYENFLRLQWFCDSKGIALVNQTYMDILHYPTVNPVWPGHTPKEIRLTKDLYRNVLPLYNMIDFNKWLFWKDTSGLYEYTKENQLDFQRDGVHPATDSHKHYVDNFLFAALAEKQLIR